MLRQIRIDENISTYAAGQTFTHGRQQHARAAVPDQNNRRASGDIF